MTLELPASGRRPRWGRLSLRWRLSLSFAGIAVLTVAVVAAVLIPLLARHYAGAQKTYLEAAAERAVRDLSTVAWKREPAQLAAVVQNLARITQAHVTVLDEAGRVLSEADPQPTTAGQVQEPSLPDPFGGGLFGGDPVDGELHRSDASVERPVQRNGRPLGLVRLSGAPAYGEAALRDVARALAVAAAVAVLLAGVAGWWVSSRLSAPIVKLTRVSDRMARGELHTRAAIDRGDEVGRLADSFNTMAERVEETVASGRRFVADAAHEFGTPLTALQADLELAREHAQSADECRLIDAAAAEAYRLEHLSTGLLRLSRLESGDLREEKQPVDLVGVVCRSADAVASRADQKGIEVRVEVPDEVVMVPAYESRLEIAYGNLVDNALKFTPAEGTVTLGLRADAGTAVLSVADTGIGIPADERDQLFERFHRGRNAVDYPGSGLGLAVVRATMDIHGGSVEVESGPAGSRFELRLPVQG